MSAPRPYNLVAELTYRCPLRCPYCSNPLDFRSTRDGLAAADWARVFAEAAELGVVHVGLTGGEPSLRGDLPEIVAGAETAGLYTLLVTAGLPIDAEGLARLVEAGLRSVQLSVQDPRPAESERIAGTESFDAKLRFARAVREQGLPLILNVVLQRENIDRVDEVIALARELGAFRLELANVQIHGWAVPNRDALLPSRAQLDAAALKVSAARQQSDFPEILYVLPDYFADRPKPCMGGWGQRALVVAPDGCVQPCHEARSIPGLELWNVRERPLRACWEEAPGMNAFRGEAWMREPCKSCPERSRDFGGCRCQALRLSGDAANTDPACALSPHHASVQAARDRPPGPLRYRGA